MRWEKHHQGYRIFAVLSGTSTSLTNFFPDKDPLSSSTRCLRGTDGYYNIEGDAEFDPFDSLRTMGCLAHNRDFTLSTDSIRCNSVLLAMLQELSVNNVSRGELKQ